MGSLFFYNNFDKIHNMKKFVILLPIVFLCGCKSQLEIDYNSAKSAVETFRERSNKKYKIDGVFFKSRYHEQFSKSKYNSFSENYFDSSFKFTYSSVEKLDKEKNSKAKLFLNDFKDCSFSDEQVKYETPVEGLVDGTTTYFFNREKMTLSVGSKWTYILPNDFLLL